MSDMMKKFGKYFLLDQIAQGGMAEIYRARMATTDGGGRLLAIKRIIQTYSSNPEFVTMFKSEIKTTSGFTHPNIVQLYDYGEEQNMLYIAMEYVDGKNLRQFISRFSELKTPFPVEAAVYILEQAAHGMGYAHAYKDKFSGKSLNIVHRDISPQNLLISYDGAVKVIDFGIAKAVTNSEATRAGVIKGKPSYLSPEQISGESLDGRSDIFALGTVLWELLASRKLFAADNDFGVLKLIENCANHVKPPSMYNPKVPKELDAIVLKCLQKNRDQRYSAAEELQRALHKFLYQFSPDFNPNDLSYYARDLFKNEIVDDRKKLLKLNEKAEQLLETQEQEAAQPSITMAADDEEEATLPAGPQAAPPKKPKATPPDRSGSFRMVDFKNKNDKTDVMLDYGSGTGSKTKTSTSFTPAANSTKFIQKAARSGKTVTGLAYQEKTSSSSMFSRVAAIALVCAGLGGYWYYENNMQGPSPAATSAKAVLTISGNVKAATVMIDEKQVATSLPATLTSVPADRPFTISVSSNGFKKYSKELELKSGESRDIKAVLEREGDVAVTGTEAPSSESAAPKPVTVQVNVMPSGVGTHIKINGSSIDSSGVTTVNADTPLDLVVEREGFRVYRKTVTIDSSSLKGTSEANIMVTLDPAKFGFVSIKTTPSADVIMTIDGIEEKWATPVSRRRIPVGTYKAKLVNSLLGMEKQVSFTVSEDRFTNIEERLHVSDEPSRVPGSR